MSDVVWLESEVEDLGSGEEALARVAIPPSSGFFEGHFPGQPVLPAVAQLALLTELVANRLGGCVAGIAHARFRATVGPGDELRLRVSRAGSDYRFVIDGPVGRVSQGVLTSQEVSE